MTGDSTSAVCADCGQSIHRTNLPPVAGWPVYYHDSALAMWQCPGLGAIRPATTPEGPIRNLDPS